MSTVASSSGVPPVPSITRTWVRAVSPAGWAGAAARASGANINHVAIDVRRTIVVDLLIDEILSARWTGNVAGARGYSYPALGRRLSALSHCRVCSPHPAHRCGGGLGHSPVQRPQGSVAGSLLAVMQQAEDVILLEPVASVEKVEFDGESQADNPGAQLTNQLYGCFHRSPGSQQIIHD